MKKKFFAVALATTMALSTAMTAFAVDVKDTISGDLTVTGFFNEKTDAVALKSGDSYTFKFNNKSNGTNNYENYVMAVTGAIGDAYTGADQEVLIVRADNWGWGGGMSDFVAPDAKEGNKLAFETNVEDWDAWKAAAQAGFACEVTIKRDGNTLTYDAKTGDSTFKTTATSGKDLPETCYVFFTGENCNLTGFTTTKAGGSSTPEPDSTPSTDPTKGPDAPTTKAPAATTAGKTTPKTGDVAPVAALAAVAVVACAAVVVSKKKVTE